VRDLFKLVFRIAVCLAVVLAMVVAGFGIGGYVLVRLTKAQSDGSLVPATAVPTAAEELGGAPTQGPASQATEAGPQSTDPASLTGGAQAPGEPTLPPQEPGSVVLPSPMPPEPSSTPVPPTATSEP